MLRKMKAQEVEASAQCLESTLYSAESMSGSVQYLIDKNLNVLEPFLKQNLETRKSIYEKDALKDDEGNFILEEDEQGVKSYTYETDGIKLKCIADLKEYLATTEFDVEINQIPLTWYSEVKIQTKTVVAQNILFDIYIDENK